MWQIKIMTKTYFLNGRMYEYAQIKNLPIYNINENKFTWPVIIANHFKSTNETICSQLKQMHQVCIIVNPEKPLSSKNVGQKYSANYCWRVNV